MSAHEGPGASTYTMEEVARHGTKGDAWMVIHGKVYDVSEFASIHPGGAGMLMMVAGKDATEYFDELHSDDRTKRRVLANLLTVGVTLVRGDLGASRRG